MAPSQDGAIFCRYRRNRGVQETLQLVHHVGVLPGQVNVGAAEVTVSGGLLVDGTAQVQLLNDLGRTHIKALVHDVGQLLLGEHAGAIGIHQHGHGMGHANGVG